MIVHISEGAKTEESFFGIENRYRKWGCAVARKRPVEYRLTGEAIAHYDVSIGKIRARLIMLREGDFLSFRTHRL